MGMRGERKLPKASSERFIEPEIIGGEEWLKKYLKENFNFGKRLNLYDLANKMGIVVEESTMQEGVAGNLQNKDGKWIIGLNKNHSDSRKRFTLAHELGHYVLHRRRQGDFSDSVFFRSFDMDNIEYAANEFASEILMPESEVRKLITDKNIKNISILANEFGVSVAAMRYRLVHLGYQLK